MQFPFVLVGVALLAASANLAAQPQLIQGPNAAIWSETAGGVTHRPTGVTFPAELQGFKRTTRLTSLDPAGGDVALGYARSEGDDATEITVYLFKPGALPEHRLKGSVAAFGTLSPEAFIWANGPFAIEGAQPLRGYKGVYKTGIGANIRMDYLYFLELGGWTVKVRATMNRVKDPAQEGAIDAFVRALPWPALVAASPACSGSACAPASASVAFDSHYMELMMGRLLFAKSRFDRRAERSLPVVAQAALPLGPKADIRRSAAEPLLYVTEVEGFATYRLMRLPDPIVALVREGFGKLSVDAPLYGLLIGNGDELLMPRLFAGEPTPEMFGAAVGELILHPTANPFVTVADTAAAMPD